MPNEPKNEDTNPFDLDEEESSETGSENTAVDTDTEVDSELDEDGDTEIEDDTEAQTAEAAEKAAYEAALKDTEARRVASLRQAELGKRRSQAPVAPAPVRSSKMFVRIKKYDEKRGQTMRTYSCYHHGTRATFVEGKGWYDVDLALAEELRTVRCSDMDLESKLAFDVCTQLEANRLEDAEEAKAAREQRSSVSRPRSAIS